MYVFRQSFTPLNSTLMQRAAYLYFAGDYRGLIKRPTKIYGLSENSCFQTAIFGFFQFREKTVTSAILFVIAD